MNRINFKLLLGLTFAVSGLSAMNPGEISKSKRMINNAITEINNPVTPFTKIENVYNTATQRASEMSAKGIPSKSLQEQLNAAYNARIQQARMRGEISGKTAQMLMPSIQQEAATVGAYQMELNTRTAAEARRQAEKERNQAILARAKKLKASEQATLTRVQQRDLVAQKRNELVALVSSQQDNSQALKTQLQQGQVLDNKTMDSVRRNIGQILNNVNSIEELTALIEQQKQKGQFASHLFKLGNAIDANYIKPLDTAIGVYIRNRDNSSAQNATQLIVDLKNAQSQIEELAAQLLQ